MGEHAATLLCRYCGAERLRYLGDCAICGEAVCESCGNLQDSQTRGRVAMHNSCMQSSPEEASSAFSFIKFIK